MPEKCKKAKGATLVLCDAAAYAVSQGFVSLQHMRDLETHKLRERLALVQRKENAPLHFCPWCRANIDNRPLERAAQAAKEGSDAA